MNISYLVSMERGFSWLWG